MPRISIRDVATRAGVSVGTVSNVLNRPDLVAEDTRFRVQEAIDELGFVRNETARRLRQGRSRTVGVLLETMTNPCFTDIGQGAEAAMYAQGFTTLWCTSDGLPGKEQRWLDVLEQQGACGAVVTPVDLTPRRATTLHRRGMAVVLVDQHTEGEACSVRVDHVAGGQAAIDHLLRRRHKRLAYVSGPSGRDRDRRSGALRAVRRAGLGDAAMITVIQDAMTPTAGKEAARHLLGMDPMPTGVFCSNDLLAIGFVNELLRSGVKVPEEISVVGYDDIELAATAAVPLTTVRQPRRELGGTAAELALAEAGDPKGHAHQEIVLRPELVRRDSA